MSDEEIFECVEIIGFDYKKHTSVAKAIKDLFEGNKDFKDVLIGKNSSEVLQEKARLVLEAYKKLSNLDIEDIRSAIEQYQTVDETEELDVKEIVFYNDSDKASKVILQKNPETRQYEVLNTMPESSFLKGIFLLADADTDKVYNSFGEIIIDIAKELPNVKNHIVLYFIERNIFKIVSNGNPVMYFTLDGRNKFKTNDSLYSKNVQILMNNYKISYMSACKLFQVRKEFKFLKSWQITDVYDKYIRVEKDKETAFYDLEGNLIVSTINSSYCYIGRIYRNKETNKFSKDNIVVVAICGRDLCKKYGYYDLDKRCEIIPADNQFIIPWNDMGFTLNESAKFYVKDCQEIKCYEPDKFVIELQALKRSFFECIQQCNDDLEILYELVRKKYWNHLFPLIIKKLKPGVYMADGNFSIFKNNRWIDQANTKTDFNKCEDFDYYDLFGFAVGFSLSPVKTSFGTNCILYAYDENEQTLLFLESFFKSSNPNNSIINTTTENLIQQSSGTLSNSCEMILGQDYEKGYNGKKFIALRINDVSKDGNIVFGFADSIGNFIADRVTKKIIYSPNYSILKLYENGDFLVLMKRNDIDEEFVMNTKKGQIIGPEKNIFDPIKNIYITFDGNKYKAYDLNGNQILKEVDKIEWVTKYYVNSKGKIIKTDKLLQVRDKGYVYLLEADGDKIIDVPKANVELLEIINEDESLKLLLSPDNRDKRKND